MKELIREFKKYIDAALDQEPDLLKALAQLSDDQSIRILTVHKRKGLEFDLWGEAWEKTMFEISGFIG